MRAALARSHQFDSAFHLVCEPAKCAVATAAQDSPYRSLAGELGYPLRRSLEILGVIVDLQTRSATPLRLVLDKLVWRLRYIKLLPAPVHRKIQLLWPLAFASVFWCAGVAAPNSSVLDSIQTETLNVFTSSFTHEVPAFLKHVLLGWHTSPQFLQDFTALRRAALFGALRPLWLEDAPLTEGAASWMALLPQARDALQRHGWTALPHEQGFSRTDALGRRRDFHFGHTSLRVLRQWLEEAFVSQGVHKCGRVRAGFHRPDPACARGLDLPKPPKTATFSFAAHRACLLAPARTLISESGSCGRSQLLVPSLWQASQGAGAGGQALHVWPHGALSSASHVGLPTNFSVPHGRRPGHPGGSCFRAPFRAPVGGLPSGACDLSR